MNTLETMRVVLIAVAALATAPALAQPDAAAGGSRSFGSQTGYVRGDQRVIREMVINGHLVHPEIAPWVANESEIDPELDR